MPLKLFKRGKIWHYRGTVAGRLLRGSTKTASKETAQRIAADKEQSSLERSSRSAIGPNIRTNRYAL